MPSLRTPREVFVKSTESSVIAAVFCLLIAGCGGGGGGSSGGGNPLDPNDDDNQTPATCTTPPAANGAVTINGTVAYDRVPTQVTNTSVRLDYDATTPEPARGVVVQALACNLSIISSTVTNSSGQYSLQVGGEVPVMIRVRAQLLSSTGAIWNVRVVDNTSSAAQYVLDGKMVTTTTASETRDLHAASGWGATSYTGTRAAAPFAILDTVYGGMLKIASVAPTVNFPSLAINWSIDNQLSETEFDTDEGLLPASFFNGSAIFLLGRANQDTDEYDDHVILHEWGHYIEHNFGRSDNLGGEHSDISHLDARVAHSEGFGNAWSAIMSDDPIYLDTEGTRQSSGFGFSLETGTVPAFAGWFKEFSVQQIIYDLYDSNADGTDDIELGLAPLWQALTTVLPDTPAFVTIFSFIDGVKQIAPSQASAIDDITDAHNIEPINDAYGSTEDNWAGLSDFPGVEGAANVYEVLLLNSAQTVCTSGFYGSYNGFGVYRYFSFSAASSRSYRFSVAANFNASGATPVIVIWRNGSIIASDRATSPLTQSLTSGDYVVEIFDERNIDAEPADESVNAFDTGIDVCYAVTVTAP